MKKNIDRLISQMTLEEKAGFCSGADHWRLKYIAEMGIPQIMVADGPHGLRKQNKNGDMAGINASLQSVCYPSAAGIACSFDLEMIGRIGAALGEECVEEEISVLLGPGVNIKRSPLCGRNFEYFSEDPYLAGEMAAAYIKGIQSWGVGTCLKHFAVNNQEYRRFSVSAEVDERTLREIYLTAFEIAVKKAQPWSVMCSYNKINGTYSSENEYLMEQILRKEWGFDGCVITDWGAIHDRVKGLEAGIDLEMPGTGGINDNDIVQAVQNGLLKEEMLNRSVARVLTLIFRSLEKKAKSHSIRHDANHELAVQAACESAVLLKNDGILPLTDDKKVVFIGEYAKHPRYQGRGSSFVNAFQVVSAMEAVDRKEIPFVQGYRTDTDAVDLILEEEAVNAAQEAEVAVLFVGLPDVFESEGYDRTHLDLPLNQNHLIQKISQVQKNIVVVLHHGSPVLMPWLKRVRALLTMYLGGEGVGTASAKLLYGEVNPSGKLAETYPMKLSDTPCYLNFPGDQEKAQYHEGVFVGYRYYDTVGKKVLFPFGHGLSYTSFAYHGLSVEKSAINEGETVKVQVWVKNVGSCTGKEVVQLYIQNHQGKVVRPRKELRGFQKLTLSPGEEKQATFILDSRAFSYYDTHLGWTCENGEYGIQVGSSSQKIQAKVAIQIKQRFCKLPPVTLDTLLMDIFDKEPVYQVLEPLIRQHRFYIDTTNANLFDVRTKMLMELLRNSPLRYMVGAGNGKFPREVILGYIQKANEVITSLNGEE